MRDQLPDSIEVAEALIGKLMPTALDMIAATVDSPGTSLEAYDATLAVAETQSPLLFLALIRCAAGLATIGDLTGDHIRALADADDSTDRPTHNVD